MGFLREKLKYRCNWGHVSLVVSHGKSDEADIGVIRRIEIRASLDLEWTVLRSRAAIIKFWAGIGINSTYSIVDAFHD